ncbi:helix-turn-helix domain-containing protein [Mesorhizobium sp. B2-6-2]|uniref:AraC family transcriptional regulator n=1 Tax=Mesorhizobium sp. B2-6-2 TaxID=2589915 RepID=UPI00112AEE9B|nr:helix-turn-helix domain-containing protein [Mesorhizobium sp. B2-6-2]TPJ80174.1 AraC family transcriptional regulator [Mesorhizobium sp. B2-6-2]
MMHMKGAFDIVDLLLRGGAVALNLLVAVQFLRWPAQRFAMTGGSLFAVSIAGYGLASSGPVTDALGLPSEALVIAAVLASAFFWWFALALFRDDFAWRHVYALPPGLLLVFYGMRQWSEGPGRTAGELLHQVVVVLLLIHVVSLAVRELGDDLVDSRRRFRVVVALVLPVVGLIIAVTELYRLRQPLPEWTVLAQSSMLATLSLAFAVWTTVIRQNLFVSSPSAPQPRADRLGPVERLELQRLQSVISKGSCFEPDLSLGSLARQLSLPEHRLRRLINKGLGYRNFAAFLNDHRVAEAKRRLADPEQAREQVASIAFGLGYASLAPFNRAFRELTGLTPSDYRAQALARHVDSGNS